MGLCTWLLHAAAACEMVACVVLVSLSLRGRRPRFSTATKRSFLAYLLIFGKPIRASEASHRRLSTDVSSFSDLSSAIDTGAEINVVADITFTTDTGHIEIDGITGVTITSSDSMELSSTAGVVSGIAGGFFYIKGGSDVTISGLSLNSGSADQRGGCVYLEGSSTLTIKDVGIYNCKTEAGDAHAYGGGIYVEASTLFVYGSTFTSNTAYSNKKDVYGGAIFVTNSASKVYIVSTHFSENLTEKGTVSY